MQQILQFLTGLKANNNKEWFDKNRDNYQESKKKVLFMTELILNEIRKFDPEVPVLDPKDCVFRIFRDVRFSNDKTPYKINMGSFIAPGGRKSFMPGYYFHLEPGASFVGGGLYMPPADVLKAVRTEVFDNGDEFRSILEDPTFKSFFPSMFDDQLKTAPKGYPKDHKDIDLIKYKSFAVGANLSDDVVCGPDYINQVIDAFKALYPMNQFLMSSIHKWM